MHRCYVPKEWIDAVRVDKTKPLPADAVSRFFLVLRIKADEKVAVFDGCGREVTGYVLFNKNDKSAAFSQAMLHQQERTFPEIVLVQAALEEKKISETIKRGCEFGIDRFIIFDATRSDKFCLKKLMAKSERLGDIAKDACRQSNRLFIPAISFVPSLHHLVTDHKKSIDLGIFGDLLEKRLFSKLLHEQPPLDSALYIVVGPEGGLSEAECDYLKSMGFFGVSWAPFTLRSELAGLAAVAIFNAHNGRA